MKIARLSLGNEVYEGHIEGDYLITEKGKLEIKDLKWLPPCKPTKIIALALNYRDHAEEMNLSVGEEPIIFLKPTSSLIGHLDDIIYPKGAKFVHYEGELAVVIGSKCRKVSERNALDYVLGYTIANDVTARDFVTNVFRPPVKAKGFDTFCPVGPYIVTKEELEEELNLNIITKVNGEIKQRSNTSLMIHPVPKVISYLSEFMTLYPGDLILMGTPKGISPIKPGDVIEITIEKIGSLINRVVEED